jgi:ribosomal protein S18 acetylase RimI-like enzyme
MQELVSDAWRLEGPLVERTSATWPGRATTLPDARTAGASGCGRRTATWSRGACLYLPGTLDFQVHPRRRELLDVVLDWFDGGGELEPVGTDPRFARRGLGAAVCTFALGRLRERGAGSAIVYARGDAAYPAPLRLYESIGFRAVTRSVTFRRMRG